MKITFALLAMLGCTLVVSTAQAATYSNLPVAFDRWVYPFGSTPGSRATASLFGSGVSVGTFDDRDAQVVVGFDTSGIGAGEVVTSAVLTITIGADETFAFDSTYDDYTTYNGGTDTDAGRPIEVYGVGSRAPFTSGPTLNGFAPSPPFFLEDSDFAFADPTLEDIRHIFASDYDSGSARDISNNVRDGFNPTPWAIGQATGVAEGAMVPVNTEMTFTLDLNNPNVASYVNAGAAGGELFLALSSLHDAAQVGPTIYPIMYLDTGSLNLGATATLTLETETVVPEPSSLALAGLGLVGLGLAGWRRRRATC